MSVVEVARSWLGTPYVHQASARGAGADCLGLVRGVWREIYGTEPAPVPRYSFSWGEAGRDELLFAALQRHLSQLGADEAMPGDVLLFRMRTGAIAKHLGIASERSGMPAFIHAYSGHGVVESALTRPWRRRIVAAFRFPERTS